MRRLRKMICFTTRCSCPSSESSRHDQNSQACFSFSGWDFIKVCRNAATLESKPSSNSSPPQACSSSSNQKLSQHNHHYLPKYALQKSTGSGDDVLRDGAEGLFRARESGKLWKCRFGLKGEIGGLAEAFFDRAGVFDPGDDVLNIFIGWDRGGRS